GASIQVTDAVVGIIPLGLDVDDAMPEIIDLGSGNLTTLLSRNINVGPDDQILILGSTSGHGVDIFSTGSGFTGSVAAIDSTNTLEDLTDSDLRGNLFDANGTPLIDSLNLYESTRSGPVMIGQVGAPTGAAKATVGLSPSSSSPTYGQSLTF